MIIHRFLFILACSLIAAAPCQAAVVSLLPSASLVNMGDAFSVDLQVSDLGVGTSVGVYDIDVGFDNTVLTLGNVSFGNGLDVLGLGSIRFGTFGTGTVNLFELSLDTAADLLALQPGSFVLATLSFTAAAPGTAALTLSLNALGDAYGDSLTASLVGTSVTIGAPTSVPEPATYLLVAAALGMARVVTGRRSRM